MVGIFKAVRNGDYSDAAGEAIGNGSAFDGQGRLVAGYGTASTLRIYSFGYDAGSSSLQISAYGSATSFSPSVYAQLFYAAGSVAIVNPYTDGLRIDWSGVSGFANISGGRRADVLAGGSNNDTITGGGGNDTLSGGDGADTAVFSGVRANYTASQVGGVVTITDTTGVDGTDTLTGFETFRFSNGSATLAQLLDSTAPISPLYSLNSGPTSIGEGGSVAFTVSRNTATGPDSIPIGFTGIGASAADYTTSGLTGGSAVFAPGSLTASFTVTAVNDSLFDPNESLVVALPGDSADPFDLSKRTIYFQESSAAPTFAMSTRSLAIAEGNSGKTDFTFSIARTGDVELPQTLNYYAIGLTPNPALNDFADVDDYRGSVIFRQGETRKDITIRVQGDTIYEPDEQFALQVNGVLSSGYVSLSAVGTILNDDAPPPGTLPPVATEGADNLVGTALADRISLGLGNDTFAGGLGDDLAYGNQGDDLIYGNQGSDTIYGGQGDDRTFGGQGDDRLFGNAGADAVYGNLGADVIYGNQGNDALFGGQGDDILFGGQGDDVLVGGLGDNRLIGGLGGDQYVIGPNPGGRDLILGFNAAEGDRLDLRGQSFALTAFPGGSALLLLSGGGTLELAGVAAGALAIGAEILQ